jgi:hypothetical protein
MSWIYRQIDGWLLDPNGTKIAQGYSGTGEHKNVPQDQNLVDKGPLPCGTYTIEPMQKETPHGPDAIPLTPDPSNQMFGRAGFWMHGDNIHSPGTASEGCVIQPRFARDRVAESFDRELRVVSGLEPPEQEV